MHVFVQDFESMFGRFKTLCMKGLRRTEFIAKYRPERNVEFPIEGFFFI